MSSFGIKNYTLNGNQNVSNSIRNITFRLPKGSSVSPDNATGPIIVSTNNKALILGVNVSGATGTEVVAIFNKDGSLSAGGFSNALGGNIFSPGVFSDIFRIIYSNVTSNTTSNDITIEVLVQYI